MLQESLFRAVSVPHHHALGHRVLLSGLGAMRSNEQGLIAKVAFGVVTLVTVTSGAAVTQV